MSRCQCTALNFLQALLQSSHICKVVVVLCCTTSWFCFCMFCFNFPLFFFSCCFQISLSICSRGHHLYCLCAMQTHTLSSKYSTYRPFPQHLTAAMLDFFPVSALPSFTFLPYYWSRDKSENKSCEETVTGRACQAETDTGKMITEAV